MEAGAERVNGTLADMEPFSPMLATLHDALPRGQAWCYEPKFDGFRCLIHRDGKEAALSSRSGRQLTTFFGDVAHAAVRQLPPGCVIDGELVCPDGRGVTFEGLLRRLSQRHGEAERLPAGVVAYDLLALDSGDVRFKSLRERRSLLEAVLRKPGVISLSPQSTDVVEAERWLYSDIPGIEGVVAKRSEEPYRSGKRAWVKVKRHRTVDVVVGGIRGDRLLLGLYDRSGVLHHVGETIGLRPQELAAVIAMTTWEDGVHSFTGRPPGLGRWEHDRYDEWVECVPTVVVEVSYTQLEGSRFRHAVRLLHLRPDKDAGRCLLDDLW